MAEISETLHVDGIHCMQCPPKIGKALGGVDGVLEAGASLAGDVFVTYDDAVPAVREKIEAALAGAGFPVVQE